MNKKLIIQIIVIVAAFGGAGIVLYNGFSGGNKTASRSNSAASSAGVVASAEQILPYGSVLDFSVLTRQNRQKNNVSYPKLDPQSDVGKPVEQLIVPDVTP